MHFPEQRRNFPPGYDENDPYEGENLEEYPGWWKKHIEEFRRHELRPYRPPRFDDGTMVPPIVIDLEDRIGMRINIRNTKPAVSDKWDILIDGSRILQVPYFRHSDGYSVYEIGSTEFKEVILEFASS